MWTWAVALAAIALLAWLVRIFADRPEKSAPMQVPDAAAQGNDMVEAVELPIEDFIDLHTFAPRDVPQVVDSYLEAALQKGFGEVRLIHGKGKGIQRAQVQQMLSGHPLVRSFRDAPPQQGGWGATLVILAAAAGQAEAGVSRKAADQAGDWRL